MLMRVISWSLVYQLISCLTHKILNFSEEDID